MEELKRQRQARVLEKAAICADLPRTLARKLEEMADAQLDPEKCARKYRESYVETGGFDRFWGNCVAGPVQWKYECGEAPHSSALDKHLGPRYYAFARARDGDDVEYHIQIKPESLFH